MPVSMHGYRLWNTDEYSLVTHCAQMGVSRPFLGVVLYNKRELSSGYIIVWLCMSG